MSFNPYSEGTYNTTPPTLTNGQSAAVQLDVNGNLKSTIVGSALTDPAEGATGAAVPVKAIQIGGSDGTLLHPLLVDASGYLKVNVVTGTFWQGTQPVSGTFWQSTQPVSIATMPSTAVTNAGTFAVQASVVSVSATGSAVPASADYSGIKVGSNLVGRTGLTVGSQNAASVAIVDASGNQITTFGAASTVYTKAFGNLSASGTSTLIALSGSTVITVYKINITVAGATNIYFLDSTPTTKSAVYILTGNGSSYGDFANGSPLWTGAAGKGFQINSSVAVGINWEAWYTQI